MTSKPYDVFEILIEISLSKDFPHFNFHLQDLKQYKDAVIDNSINRAHLNPFSIPNTPQLPNVPILGPVLTPGCTLYDGR